MFISGNKSNIRYSWVSRIRKRLIRKPETIINNKETYFLSVFVSAILKVLRLFSNFLDLFWKFYTNHSDTNQL